MTPAEIVADRFMTALSSTVRRSTTPLPMPLRPMAEAIAGTRPVMLSTDEASRRALRSVRKVAATTGETIHLDPVSIPRSRLAEVVAHELTHVAHPSPAPRFFDDIDDSPEERRAERVAQVMARSPLAPSSATSAPSVRRANDAAEIRRSPAPTTRTSATAGSSPGTVSAESLAAGLSRGDDSSAAIRRWGGATPSTPPTRTQIGSHRAVAAPPAPTPSDAPDSPPLHPAPQTGSVAGEANAPGQSDESFRRQLERNLDPLLRMIEDRMIIEGERRGGRHWRRS